MLDVSMTNQQHHPTAIIANGAQLADDVAVGPYAVIEGQVSIGAGTGLSGGALPVTGVIVRSSANVESGIRSPLGASTRRFLTLSSSFLYSSGKRSIKAVIRSCS
mgnify:CR=1 FL=1